MPMLRKKVFTAVYCRHHVQTYRGRELTEMLSVFAITIQLNMNKNYSQFSIFL